MEFRSVRLEEGNCGILLRSDSVVIIDLPDPESELQVVRMFPSDRSAQYRSEQGQLGMRFSLSDEGPTLAEAGFRRKLFWSRLLILSVDPVVVGS